MSVSILQDLPDIFVNFPNWVVWREEVIAGDRLTKVPYQATTSTIRAKPNDPATWNRLSAAVKKSLHIASSEYKSGTGFVITPETGLVCIDLDNPAKLGVNEENARKLHNYLLERFSNTYIELSPSGTGYHIWLWGTLPEGRLSVSLKAQAGVEIYAGARFMTMTGNMVSGCPAVTNQQPILDELIEYLVSINGGKMPGQANLTGDEVETTDDLGRRLDLSDDEVIQIAIRSNSKFLEFFNATPAHDRSQFAKPVAGDLDKITGDPEQVIRIMMASPIGRCYTPDELERKLVNYWLPECRASNKEILEKREEGKRFQQELVAAEIERQEKKKSEPKKDVSTFNPPFKYAPQNISEYITDYPPGMIGIMAQEIRERATMRASKDFAVAAALSIFAGMSGHAYSFERVNGALYLLMLGSSGQGKEAPAEARDKLIQQLRGQGIHPDMLSGLTGPSKITSPQGLHKRLEKDKNLLGILGEATVWLNDLATTKQGIWIEIKRFILDLYGKQGKGRVIAPAEVLNKDNKLVPIVGPAATLLMEGEPSVYTDLLGSDPYTASGLCARIIHVEGNPDDMPEKNYGHTSFSDYVISNLATVVGFWTQKKSEQNAVFAAQEKGMAPMGGVTADTAWVSVKMTDECLIHHRKFDRELDFFMKANVGKIGDMYNRVVPNVLRVAVNLAAGVNPFAPVIDLDVYRWAQAFVLRGLHRIAARVDLGEVGTGDSRIKSTILKKLEEWREMSIEERKLIIRDKANIRDPARREYLASFPGMPWACITRYMSVYAQRHLNAERASQTVLNILQGMNATGEITLHQGYVFNGQTSKGLIISWVDE
jgi:hypothetical protein